MTRIGAFIAATEGLETTPRAPMETANGVDSLSAVKGEEAAVTARAAGAPSYSGDDDG